MKRIVVVTLALVLTLSGSHVGRALSAPSGPYFGLTPPGFTPEVFAPGWVSLPNRFEYCLIFSPALDECVFGQTNSSWGGFGLYYTRMNLDGTWTDPTSAPFQGDGDACYPTFSPDGQSLRFASSRPSYPPMRIWSVARDTEGWQAPEALDPPVFSGANEWGSSLTSDGTLYFCSDRAGGLGAGDIYRTVIATDGTLTVENVGSPISSPQLEGAPCIAPDGSYLIFESRRPGGYGSSDLYVSFHQAGAWTTPRNLGPGINSTYIEDGPFMSSDGKYLFFNRRRSAFTTEQSEIWWVDARAVFHPEQSDIDALPEPQSSSPALTLRPNPSRGATTLSYTLPEAGPVSLAAYDPLGRELAVLWEGAQSAGSHQLTFTPPAGQQARSVIFYRLVSHGRPLGTVRALSLR